jgi:hypothetical protein
VPARVSVIFNLLISVSVSVSQFNVCVLSVVQFSLANKNVDAKCWKFPKKISLFPRQNCYLPDLCVY